jgi:hypothetical protein
MRFSPVSEEEAATVNLLPRGDYDAVVKACTEKTSKKNGNPMFEVDLVVYGPDGKERKVRDWLVCIDTGQAKLQAFCKSAGQWDAYVAGELCAESFIDTSVRVKLGVEEGEGDFPPKNSVKNYLSRKLPVIPAKSSGTLPGVDPAKRAAANAVAADGDIPF